MLERRGGGEPLGVSGYNGPFIGSKHVCPGTRQLQSFGTRTICRYELSARQTAR